MVLKDVSGFSNTLSIGTLLLDANKTVVLLKNAVTIVLMIVFGFSRARWPLYVGKRIFHGVVDCQQLIQIDVLIDQCNRIRLGAARPF